MAKVLKKTVKKASRKPTNHRVPWSTADDRLMRRLVKEKMTAAAIAKQLGRSAAAIQQRLMLSGISLRAAKKAKTAKKTVRRAV
jgi:IS30 family transposase